MCQTWISPEANNTARTSVATATAESAAMRIKRRLPRSTQVPMNGERSTCGSNPIIEAMARVVAEFVVLGEIPDDRKLYELAAQQGQRLPDP